MELGRRVVLAAFLDDRLVGCAQPVLGVAVHRHHRAEVQKMLDPPIGPPLGVGARLMRHSGRGARSGAHPAHPRHRDRERRRAPLLSPGLDQGRGDPDYAMRPDRSGLNRPRSGTGEVRSDRPATIRASRRSGGATPTPVGGAGRAVSLVVVTDRPTTLTSVYVGCMLWLDPDGDDDPLPVQNAERTGQPGIRRCHHERKALELMARTRRSKGGGADARRQSPGAARARRGAACGAVAISQGGPRSGQRAARGRTREVAARRPREVGGEARG